MSKACEKREQGLWQAAFGRGLLLTEELLCWEPSPVTMHLSLTAFSVLG